MLRYVFREVRSHLIVNSKVSYPTFQHRERLVRLRALPVRTASGRLPSEIDQVATETKLPEHGRRGWKSATGREQDDALKNDAVSEGPSISFCSLSNDDDDDDDDDANFDVTSAAVSPSSAHTLNINNDNYTAVHR